MVFELIAGSVWNLAAIEWVQVQTSHLGYPDYFIYILGVCHVAAAAAIIVPGFKLLKEWAYAGTVFMWSGAVASHLVNGDGPESWAPPLMFAAFAAASWSLRPSDRHLPASWLSRTTDAGRPSSDRPHAWALAIGLVTVLYAVSILTLPAAEDITREWAVQRGWTTE
ncbi:DoxX family protein [Kribbella flavida]|uniref:DoxX family protein n=1 Tax=Kribbella flavida TaxID=182640 RepID=UPI0003267E9F|nr:DoxX family protein [Kribbella flavida]